MHKCPYTHANKNMYKVTTWRWECNRLSEMKTLNAHMINFDDNDDCITPLVGTSSRVFKPKHIKKLWQNARWERKLIAWNETMQRGHEQVLDAYGDTDHMAPPQMFISIHTQDILLHIYNANINQYAIDNMCDRKAIEMAWNGSLKYGH